MAQEKYVVLRRADIRIFLSKDEQLQLANLWKKIEDGRLAKAMSVGDSFFPLNLKDCYALPAIEAYIAAIEADRQNIAAQGVQEALKAAKEKRQRAIMLSDMRPPNA